MIRKKPTKLSRFLLFISWRWRESNPRPNKEPPSFLHAYSAVGFRAVQGSERPQRDLISWVSPCRRSADMTIPKLLSTSFPGRNQESPPARCLVRSPCVRIEPVTYCASIRQRERSCFRQLLFCSQDLRASLRGSACLHDNSSCCRNHTSPKQFAVGSLQFAVVQLTVLSSLKSGCKITPIFVIPQGAMKVFSNNKIFPGLLRSSQ